MISFLRGRVVSSGIDYVVVDIGGVGYKVYVPTPVIGSVADKKEEIMIYTYMNVREDSIQLFGFLNEHDLEIFELLIQISGIGPRVALSVLSFMPGTSFVQAVAQERVETLTKIPGVGKKTAQRVIIELKDKIVKIENKGGVDTGSPVPLLSNASEDALQALTALGYNPVEAKRAVGKIISRDCQNLTTEEIIKLALKELGRF